MLDFLPWHGRQAVTEGLQGRGFAAGVVLTRVLCFGQAYNPPVGSADSPLCTRGPFGARAQNRRILKEEIAVERKHNPGLVPFAKSLRKDMTKQERRLWFEFLRDYPVRFLRQKVLGKYIVDFYCAKAKLVVELDGSQHFESDGLSSDRERDRFLHEYGLTVLRFPNNAVNENFEGVCEAIDAAVKERTG